MMLNEKITKVNQILQAHFTRSSEVVPAKDFMPLFIKEGVFPADDRAGKPIRDLLRQLDRAGRLSDIPFVIAERKNQNTNWYFGPVDTKRIKSPPLPPGRKPAQNTRLRESSRSRSYSDEWYIIDLCDEVLELKALRQHTFPFLLGDANAKGTCRRLPVDAWYESLRMVIEYQERQHTEAVKHFDKRMTVSGKTRGEQRTDYDKRKLKVLPENAIKVVVLSYTDFVHNASKRLLRNREQDLVVVREKLQRFAKGSSRKG